MEVSKGLVGWSHPRANAHAHALTFLILNTDLIYVLNLNPGREDYFFYVVMDRGLARKGKGYSGWQGAPFVTSWSLAFKAKIMRPAPLASLPADVVKYRL